VKRTAVLNCASKLMVTLLLGLSATTSVHAQTVAPLFVFPCTADGSCPDGSNLNSLIQASDGNFYGTTATSEFRRFRGGTIFQLTPSADFRLLFTFTPGPSQDFPNGNSPSSGLVEGADGLLYGTAALGGANNQGVVFRIDKTGAEFEVLHSFCALASCADGAVPLGLTLGSDGSFFGQTNAGGIPETNCIQGGCGTIYRITPDGSFQVLHAMEPVTEGGNRPDLGLVNGSDGNLYGVSDLDSLDTNIFRVTPTGEFSIVFSTPEGELDTSVIGLTQASNGKLFGGFIVEETDNSVHFFEINLDGSGFQSFTPSSQILTTAPPIPSLIQASDGNLWGSLSPERSLRNGAIFSISMDGTLLRIISFDPTIGFPNTRLLQSSDGTLVGTTSDLSTIDGFPFSGGVVFTLGAGLAPPLRAP